MSNVPTSYGNMTPAKHELPATLARFERKPPEWNKHLRASLVLTGHLFGLVPFMSAPAICTNLFQGKNRRGPEMNFVSDFPGGRGIRAGKNCNHTPQAGTPKCSGRRPKQQLQLLPIAIAGRAVCLPTPYETGCVSQNRRCSGWSSIAEQSRSTRTSSRRKVLTGRDSNDSNDSKEDKT